MKWAIELNEFTVEYKPRIAMKSQAIAYFFAHAVDGEDKKVEAVMNVITERWSLYVDGAVNRRGCGLEIVLGTAVGTVVEKAIRCEYRLLNNDAEYEALIMGLRWARELGVRNIAIYSDSQLVVNQVKGTFQTKYERMA